MKKIFLASILALSLCSVAAFADTLSGYVSDAHCGLVHSKPSAANTACINKCLKGGADPVLVTDGKILKFDADSKERAAAFAGQNVTIDGSVDGDAIRINSIEKAKSQ